MDLLRRILCLIGQHRRSRGRARPIPRGWRSRCRGCGVLMEKHDGGKWQVATPAGAQADGAPVGERKV